MPEKEWRRLKSVNDRAWDLVQASSSSRKSVEDYEETLTGGSGSYTEGSRECPQCGNDKIVSVQEARAVFRVNDWGSAAMLDDADYVCSWCLSARIEIESFDEAVDADPRVTDDEMEVDGVSW